MTSRILVVEDDASILLGLRMNLEGAGYEVQTAADGQLGLSLAREHRFDLIVLDVMLPKMNGFELVSALREAGDRTPVLILTAKSGETDKIMGLDVGADDYVTKPFALGELLARVRANIRRGAPPRPEAQSFRFGEVVVDAGTREVRMRGDLVELTATEFDVLLALHGARGRILSRRQILDAVWGTDHHGTERTIDNFVAHLRAKLEVDASAPLHVLTVRGVGYRLVP
ncbi:MAG: response regulator transcription factor [Deltaproteobacteria bacterium]|nr:response regulator transcription factor [Deltaproteobacteria bacterium]